MSAIQSSSSLLSRTRSTRAHVAGAPTKLDVINNASPTTLSTTSNVALFLTNLRLLDLDLLPDWPGISSLTFSARDAAQGQRKRIQSVEWALYQLFVLWDAEDARNKLQPFFPPLDQVQSLNLRAALLRSLEQAKKTGVLGRDAVVRKTMLDECKGERLEEVLAVFSSAVLKKLVAEQQLNEQRHPALAQSIALENRGYSAERTELNVLVLAHKASVASLLREKKAAHAKFEDFADLLALKGRSIARRQELIKSLNEGSHTKRDNIADDVRLNVRRVVRNNWSGNERWLETVVCGDANAQRDGLLTSPYDRVWRRVQSGRLAELEDQSGGLLEQLEHRVKAQQDRLAKWESFHKQHFSQAGDQAPHKAATHLNQRRGLDLGFGAQESLYSGRMSPRKQINHGTTALSRDYADLVNSFKSELANIDIGEAKPFLQNQQLGTAPRRQLSPALSAGEVAVEEVISEISELEDELAAAPYPDKSASDEVAALHPVEDANRHKIPTPSQATLQENTERKSRPHLPQNLSNSSRISTPSSSPSPIRETPASPPELPVSATQQLADQILASMSATSPSPVKTSKPRHTLSLAERTRLSMARSSRVTSFEDEEPDLAASSGRSLSRSPEKQVLPNSSSLEDVAEGDPEDLVARTRRSMVNFEASRQKAQLERRRSQRRSRQQPHRGGEGSRASYFPAVGEGDSTLLAEEMMAAGEDDYEAVFMSRPKIKTSPVSTPVKGWN